MARRKEEGRSRRARAPFSLSAEDGVKRWLGPLWKKTVPLLSMGGCVKFCRRFRQLSPAPFPPSWCEARHNYLLLVGLWFFLPSFQGEGVAPRVPRRTDGERGQCWGQVREGRKSRRTCSETWNKSSYAIDDHSREGEYVLAHEQLSLNSPEPSSEMVQDELKECFLPFSVPHVQISKWAQECHQCF